MQRTVTMQRRSPDASLKSKLKEHYNNRNFVPEPSQVSRIGLIATACLIFILFLEILVFLLPGLYSVSDDGAELWTGWFGEGYVMALLVAVFSWVEVTWNWWRTYYDVPNWVTKEMKVAQFGQMLDTPPGWRHCPTCQLDAPPRSHHCNHCHHCILKRDHHCFFTGSCVGFYNQRHFVMFLIYAMWGLCLGLYFQMAYLQQSLPLPENYIMYIVPVSVVQFLMGNLSFWKFLLIAHVYINVFFVGVGLLFFGWQIIIIFRGQTSHEAFKRINLYDEGLYRNFTCVFGSPKLSWILWFAPLLLPLEADGTKWTVQAKSQKVN